MNPHERLLFTLKSTAFDGLRRKYPDWDEWAASKLVRAVLCFIPLPCFRIYLSFFVWLSLSLSLHLVSRHAGEGWI